MSQVITATYADGMLKPDIQPNLVPGTRVRIILEPLECAPEATHQVWEELERLCAEFPLDSGGVILTRDQLHERR